MTSRQFPPSSPPVPPRRELLPSFESAIVAGPSPGSSSTLYLIQAVTPSRKRAYDQGSDEVDKEEQFRRLPPLQQGLYPTPAPTSSASQNTSSPSNQMRLLGAPFTASSGLSDFSSTSVVRTPLSTILLARLPRSGHFVKMGRSSNSSSVVLSRMNKLISRVHVVARYVKNKDSIEVKCVGWNGLQIATPTVDHVLAKGETCLVDANQSVFLEVCGEKARIEVIEQSEQEKDADDDETDEEVFVSERQRLAIEENERQQEQEQQSNVGFKIWEDNYESSLDKSDEKKFYDVDMPAEAVSPTPVNSIALPREALQNQEPKQEKKSVKHEQHEQHEQHDSKQEQKQDHQEQDQKQKYEYEYEQEQEQEQVSPMQTTANLFASSDNENQIHDLSKLKTHVIAHLAYSRLSTTPLSVLRSSVPIIKSFPIEIFRSIVKDIACVGVIKRQGKDASGKRLEEQYYYIPEHDLDEHRRRAVEELRGHPGLRSCRKVHKQYYWKKPAQK
ncbi:hypothetical protein V1514DRAFT_337254 [Lipomyces japonicus]|uniref:uncharacterized protein n=1 Tax=Lipomyces japonicus TaxID=56871 RepID=UPI0034CDE5FF